MPGDDALPVTSAANPPESGSHETAANPPKGGSHSNEGQGGSHISEGLPTSALAGMMLATSLAPLGSTMIAVALPRIGQDIGADVSNLTPWLVSSYLITSIAFQSTGGKVGDLIGHTRGLLLGLALVTVGSFIGILGAEVRTLGLARVLTAAGGAATVPATMAILRNRTPVHRRARMF